MPQTLAKAYLAPEGNEVSTGFQRPSKAFAVKVWQELTAAVDDKVLAAECEMSAGYYSKVSTGQQGDLIELAYRLPAHRSRIRADFFGRLAEGEQVDPVLLAGEQAMASVARFMRLVAARGIRPRMMKAQVR